jgi:hypothetical protein
MSSGNSSSFEVYFAPLKKHFKISVFKMTRMRFVTVFEDITARKNSEIEIKRKMDELEKFHRISVGRELRMIELKKTVEQLKRKLGEKK